MMRRRLHRRPKKVTKDNNHEVRIAAKSLALHKKHAGIIEVRSHVKLTETSFPLVYTPGVSAVVAHLSRQPQDISRYTARGRTIAIISDGSAVLGLGNVGPGAALPVMEGKAALFKQLVNLDAFPIVLQTQDPNEIIDVITALAPSFGAINLEDISAPKCFEIERRLSETLSIPVIHDDQHGTAVAVLAGLMNAHTVVGKSLSTSRIAIIGSGAAGTAIAKLLKSFGVGDVVVVDTHGIVSDLRTDLTTYQEELVHITNRERRFGGILEAVVGADAVIGVSTSGVITTEHIRMMAQHPIVFALANPAPEIYPHEAYEAGAAIVATGRPDYPNHISNALVFPGLFKGVLEHGVVHVTDAMKISAATNLASLVRRPTKNMIVPSVFNSKTVLSVMNAIT